MPSRADLTTRPNRDRCERPDDARHRQRPAERTTPQTRDGRRERTEVTRRRILDATRELILSGSFDPTAQAVAARAGITTRTLFRHFADMRTLHREIILDAQRYAHAVMDEPFPGEPGSENRWPALLQAVIERRVRIYEYLFPLHISAIYQRYRSTATEQAISQDVQRRRKRLKEILPRQLAAEPLLFESLDAILSIEFWISLRQDQQLTVAQATQVLRYAAGRLAERAMAF